MTCCHHNNVWVVVDEMLANFGAKTFSVPVWPKTSSIRARLTPKRWKTERKICWIDPLTQILSSTWCPGPQKWVHTNNPPEQWSPQKQCWHEQCLSSNIPPDQLPHPAMLLEWLCRCNKPFVPKPEIQHDQRGRGVLTLTWEEVTIREGKRRCCSCTKIEIMSLGFYLKVIY